MGEHLQVEETRVSPNGNGPPPSPNGDAHIHPSVRWDDRATEAQLLGDYRAEIAAYRQLMNGWGDRYQADPASVLQEIASVSARVGEIRGELQDASKRAADQLRTRHVDPLREDLQFQFSLVSRYIAWIDQEWRMQGGQV